MSKKSVSKLPNKNSSTVIKKNVIPLRKQQPPRRSLTDFYLKELKEKSIFDSVQGECCCSPGADTSMLVTGFGMRNWESLQNALLADQFARKDYEIEVVEEKDISSSSKESSYRSSTEHTTSQTDISTTRTGSSDDRKTLEYLMGIADAAAEEEEEKEEQEEAICKDEYIKEEMMKRYEITGRTEAMRKAQRYLRSHRIFEFFQFLITHMLSARPENPIQFLLNILDKLLLYRSGIGAPPLLYDKKHIEQLFYLMDRMRTDYIEIEQYKSGMKTLGICIYNKNPPLSADCMVSKKYFIEEAYECLIDILNDMIYKKKCGQSTVLEKSDTKKTYLGSGRKSLGSPFVVDPDFYTFLAKNK